MALSLAAEKLLAWFGLYKLTPGEYYTILEGSPKAQQRGLFVDAFDELLAEYGY